MKKITQLLACCLLGLSTAFAQVPAPFSGPQPLRAAPPPVSRFNIDFPGGTPAQLVAAIEKASGKPVNVIVKNEDAHEQLPPLKMNEVTVPELFEALSVTARPVWFFSGKLQYDTTYGFRTVGNQSENSIWYFSSGAKPPTAQMATRFYSLEPYLDRGFTVDDITTAIQTGWKMEDQASSPVAPKAPMPTLNYHKETKMLIAHGELGRLNTLEVVLGALPRTNAKADELGTMHAEIKKLQDRVEWLVLAHQHSEPPAQPEKSGK